MMTMKAKSGSADSGCLLSTLYLLGPLPGSDLEWWVKGSPTLAPSEGGGWTVSKLIDA